MAGGRIVGDARDLGIAAARRRGGLAIAMYREDLRLALYRGSDQRPRERLDDEAHWVDLQGSARVVWTADDQPIRQIAPRSRLPVGRYNSRKAGRMLHHQSRGHGFVGGEKLALMKCEIDPEIADYRSQHVRFDVLLDGSFQSFFPDIVALRHDGTVQIIEVKKDSRWQRDPSYRSKLEVVRAVCRDIGWGFDVWTQSDIAPTSRVRDNISQIQMQRFISIGEVELLLVERALRKGGGSIAVGEVKETLDGARGAGDLVRGLMCRGILSLPLDQLITDATMATIFDRCLTPQLEHAA